MTNPSLRNVLLEADAYLEAFNSNYDSVSQEEGEELMAELQEQSRQVYEKMDKVRKAVAYLRYIAAPKIGGRPMEWPFSVPPWP